MIVNILNLLIKGLERIRFRVRTKRLFNKGLRLGKNVYISQTAHVDDNYPYLLEIGGNSHLCDNVLILSHDGTVSKFTGGCTRLGRVKIGDNCYVGENSIILPGVTIGDNVIVAPNSIVNKKFSSNLYIAGRPARVHKKLEELVQENKVSMQGKRNILEKGRSGIDLIKLKGEIMEMLDGTDAYLKVE